VLLLNHHIETDILNAKGKAYGIELLLRKPSGKINGWVSYTFSRSFLQTIGSTSVETVNQGKFYPSSYDKPHAFNFIGNYKFSRRFNFSLNTIYSTGRPITIPIGVYTLDGSKRWTFAIYNLLGRHNAYSVYFVSQNGNINGYQLSIFAQPIPTLTYNFRL
jgi:hypothetical protein